MDSHPGPSGEVMDTNLLRRAFGTFATGAGPARKVASTLPHGCSRMSFSMFHSGDDLRRA